MSDQEKQVSRVGKVVDQATAVFDGAEIAAVRADDGFIYASLPHLCRALGLDLESQRNTVDEHAVLTQGLLQFPLVSGVRILTPWCLRPPLIAFWLAVIPTTTLPPDPHHRTLTYPHPT